MENIATIPVNGMPIFTRSTGNTNKAIIFIHGGLQRSDIWDPQLKDELLQEAFRLVALDLPGHGRSGRSATPEQDYSIAGMARQLADYINGSTWESYVLAGISSGTNIISEALPLLTIPPKGLFFAGAAIVNRDIPWTAALLASPFEQVLTATPSDAALTAYSKRLVYRPTDQFIAGCKQYYYDTDPVFRTTFGRYMRADGAGTADHIDGLQHSQLPLCLVMGQHENVVRINYLDGVSFKRKWKDTIFKVPAAGHLVNYDQPQVFNHLLWQFAEEVLK
jgi:pimeloyl-ACP methyl ester carboxylesterase